jgi:hypothetical protein
MERLGRFLLFFNKKNNTTSTVKWQRYMKGKLVETQEKTVKSTIGGAENSILVEY